MLFDFELMYYLGYMIFALLGLFHHPFFYTYHLIDIIYRNSYLKNVLKALYRPRFELFNTFILFLVIEFAFSVYAYIFFEDEFNGDECT